MQVRSIVMMLAIVVVLVLAATLFGINVHEHKHS